MGTCTHDISNIPISVLNISPALPVIHIPRRAGDNTRRPATTPRAEGSDERRFKGARTDGSAPVVTALPACTSGPRSRGTPTSVLPRSRGESSALSSPAAAPHSSCRRCRSARPLPSACSRTRHASQARRAFPNPQAGCPYVDRRPVPPSPHTCRHPPDILVASSNHLTVIDGTREPYVSRQCNCNCHQKGCHGLLD